MDKLIDLATARWRLIAGIAVAIAIGAALWFLIFAPRLEAARLREAQAKREAEIAEQEAARERVKEEAKKLLVEAANQVAQERAQALGAAAQETASHNKRTAAVRERAAARAARPQGDPYVSEGMNAFLEDLKQ